MTETFTFSGPLTLGDMARHIPHSFAVPEGIRTIRLAYEIDPPHPGIGPLPHQVSLSLDGPAGSRGAQHNLPWLGDSTREISEGWASPGYMPGAIEPGEWTVSVDVFRILPPGNTSYRVHVTLLTETVEGPALPPPTPVTPRGPGWYVGDLHGHTEHSDGRWSVADFMAHARDRRLDFVTMTDHNSVSGHPWGKALAGDDLLVMGGVEVTTFHGHALALGADAWVDWRIRDGQTMTERAEAIMASGQTFVIAHPMAIGHPWCAGCHWEYADVYPGPARLVEIWNSGWDDHKNELGLRLFKVWLDKGIRMRATAGTDIHGPTPREVRVGYNRVWAEALDEPSLLAGIRAGHNVLTAGPLLDVSAEVGGATYRVGDLVPEDRARLHLGWSDVPEGAVIKVLSSAGQVFSGPVPPSGERMVELGPMAEKAWVMVELRCAAGQMLAVTNPIFFPGDWA